MPLSTRRREARLSDFFRSRSAEMRNVLRTVEKAVDHDVPVLILGETGCGKSYLAEAIHACSRRRGEPFVTVDCATVPPDLFESELFGYEKGTFTDAVGRKPGKLELARGGSVYFDNVDTLSSALQAKLLRAVEERRFTRLGGAENVPFTARVISSATADVDSLRPDLLYRINVVTVTIPPLRERPKDIVPLAVRFAARRKALSAEAEAVLASRSWPGNVRELRNAVERAVLLTDGETIAAAAFPFTAGELVTTARRSRWTLDQLEATYIREVLRDTRSNYRRAAEILGINRKTLLEKRRKYGLD